MESFAQWLDGTAVSTALKNNFWIVPSLQSVHILSICLVLTSAVIVSLRAWSLIGADWTPQQWARRLYPVHWWALLALLCTGLLQALAEPTRDLPNKAFQLKMLLVLIVVPIALWMTRRFYMVPAGGAAAHRPALLLRFASVIVVLFWLAIIFLGRWIAYL